MAWWQQSYPCVHVFCIVDIATAIQKYESCMFSREFFLKCIDYVWASVQNAEPRRTVVLFQAIVRYLTYGYVPPRIPQKHFITAPAMIGLPRLTHPGQPPIYIYLIYIWLCIRRHSITSSRSEDRSTILLSAKVLCYCPQSELTTRSPGTSAYLAVVDR